MKKAELTKIGKLYETELLKHYNESNVISFLHRRRLPTHKVVTNLIADTDGKIDANFVYGFFLGFPEYITGSKRVYKDASDLGNNIEHRLQRDSDKVTVKGYIVWDFGNDRKRVMEQKMTREGAIETTYDDFGEIEDLFNEIFDHFESHEPKVVARFRGKLILSEQHSMQQIEGDDACIELLGSAEQNLNDLGKEYEVIIQKVEDEQR